MSNISPLLPLGVISESHPASYLCLKPPKWGYELLLNLYRPGYIFPLGALEKPERDTILIHDLWAYKVLQTPPPPPYFPFPDPDLLQCLNVQFLRYPVKEQIGKGKKKAVVRLEIVVTHLSDLEIFSEIERWYYYGKEVKKYKEKETPWSKGNIN